MRLITKFITCSAILVGLVAPCSYAAPSVDQFQAMVTQLQQKPSDNELRIKVIKQARSMKHQPVIPDEAIRREGRGKFAFKNAKSAADYLDAVREYEQAVTAAPWVTGYYSDLCTIYEKAGKYSEARNACGVYLQVITDPNEITSTKERIAGLEFGIEKGSSAATIRSAPAPAIQPTTEQVINLKCRSSNGVFLSLTIDPAEKSITEEWRTPCPGCEGPNLVDGYMVDRPRKYPDPSGEVEFSMQVTDASVEWSEHGQDRINIPNPALFSLNRYTGSLHQTIRAGGPMYPQGWDVTFTCEKRQKL